ncbi:UDP-N-acetylmuramate--L-alanine ligase [Candidatus Marinimicrobia bacterium]|nr:UDP-N-acetylmuramate--L-alanine ligase [Candidatus Neomarinimicrobiota bacterium]
MLSSINRIHFIGIGGIGMSGIAELLFNQNFKITGSDLSESSNTDRLKKLDIPISIGHDRSNISSAEIVVYSDAIPKDNVELIEANDRNIQCYSRGQIISQLAKLKSSTVGISGTHGKTTTTSMIGSILKDSNLDPTIIVGGVVKSINTNSVLGSGDTFVVEADEFNRTFLQLSPTIAVINNIDLEHIDCYKDIDDLKGAFIEFANSVPFYGMVSICKDSENAAAIIPSIDKPIVTYGIESDDVDFRAINIVHNNGKVVFDLIFKEQSYPFSMNVPGEYNIFNALAAISVCKTMGLSLEDIRRSLKMFSGVKRRFDIKIQNNDLMIIDDYAHHPVEVSSVIKAIKSNWDRRLLVIFQPHLYSRTKQFYKEFAEALQDADLVFVTEIFASREKLDASITSEKIGKYLKELNHNNVFNITTESLITDVKSKYMKGDIILTVGAGNIWRFADKLSESMQ